MIALDRSGDNLSSNKQWSRPIVWEFSSSNDFFYSASRREEISPSSRSRHDRSKRRTSENLKHDDRWRGVDIETDRRRNRIALARARRKNSQISRNGRRMRRPWARSWSSQKFGHRMVGYCAPATAPCSRGNPSLTKARFGFIWTIISLTKLVYLTKSPHDKFPVQLEKSLSRFL